MSFRPTLVLLAAALALACAPPPPPPVPDATDTCGVDHGGCDAHADCVYDKVSGSRCVCHDGWRGDGTTCADVDECEVNEGGCDPDATCVNLPGAHECRCNEGWTGDGSSCRDLDECATGNGGCAPDATCTNRIGTRLCACHEGFEGDGETCLDVDECATDRGGCGEHATCENAPGTFRCVCEAGYTVSGGRCVDADECANGLLTCRANAVCESLPGPDACRCADGFEGDGASCTDVDECALDTDGCDARATCVNTPGTFRCACPAGFETRGLVCADVDECATNHGGCSPRATCTNTPGTRTCACDAPYVGDGFTCVSGPWLQPIPATGGVGARSVATDLDGNVWVVGWVEGTVPGGSPAGGKDAFLAKFTGTGQLVWMRQLGSAFDDEAVGVAADATGVWILGTVRGAIGTLVPAGTSDLFLARYDGAGNRLALRLEGAAGADEAGDLALRNGVLFASGTAGAAVDPASWHGGTDALLLRLDATTGERIWARHLGSTGDDTGAGLAVAPNGDVALTGRLGAAIGTEPFAGGFDAYAARFSVDGIRRWVRVFGSPGDDAGFDVAATEAEVVVSGEAAGALHGEAALGGTDAFVTRFLFDGTHMWTRLVGTAFDDTGRGVATNLSGTSFLVSRVDGRDASGFGGTDVSLRVFDVGGTNSGVRQQGTAEDEDAGRLVFDADGQLIGVGNSVTATTRHAWVQHL